MNAKQRSLSKGEGKFKLTWMQYINHIYKLIDMINNSKIKFDYVYGIPRGGNIPANIIAHELDIFLMDTDSFFRHRSLVHMFKQNPQYFIRLGYKKTFPNGKILVVDDICDTGKTLTNYIFESLIQTATIFKHTKSPVIPDFYVTENNQWIQFPYERN